MYLCGNATTSGGNKDFCLKLNSALPFCLKSLTIVFDGLRLNSPAPWLLLPAPLPSDIRPSPSGFQALRPCFKGALLFPISGASHLLFLLLCLLLFIHFPSDLSWVITSSHRTKCVSASHPLTGQLVPDPRFPSHQSVARPQPVLRRIWMVGRHTDGAGSHSPPRTWRLYPPRLSALIVIDSRRQRYKWLWHFNIVIFMKEEQERDGIKGPLCYKLNSFARGDIYMLKF